MVSPIEALPIAIDRSLLHVFVVGPGVGEAIAVALPERGWLVIDACKVGREVPVLELVTRRRDADEPVIAVWTHPHEDHASGLPEILGTLAPSEVFVTGQTPIGPHLFDVAKAWADRRFAAAAVTSSRKRASSVVSALKALESSVPAVKSALDGTIILSRADLAVVARAPEPGTHLDAVLAEIARGQLHRANQASVVIEITWGETRVVLGGDLPTTAGSNEVDVPTGWNRVMSAHPHLAKHALLKVPHHGSAGADHPGLMASGSETLWFCTPYRAGLPDPTTMVPRLVQRNGRLHVTHPPGAWADLGEHTGTVRLPEIQPRHVAQPTGDPFADASVDITPSLPKTALSPVWGVSLDRHGAVRELWRGRSAVEVQP